MKYRNAIMYGLVSGFIVSFGMLVWWLMPSQRERIYDFAHSMMFVLGLMNMIIGFMTIVILHKRMRNDSEGALPFKRLFASGLIITIVATIIYVSVWMIVYENGGNQLMEVIQTGRIERIEHSDNSPEVIAEKVAETREFMKDYEEDGLFRAGVTTLEVFPVGLVFAIMSGLLFQRRKQNFLP